MFKFVAQDKKQTSQSNELRLRFISKTSRLGNVGLKPAVLTKFLCGSPQNVQ